MLPGRVVHVARGDRSVGSGLDHPGEIYTIPAELTVNHVTYVTVEEDNDDEWVTFAYVAAYTGRDDRMGLRGVGQRLLLSALRRLRWVLPYYSRTRTPTGWAPGITRIPAPTVAAMPHMGRMAAWAWARRYNPRTGTYSRGAAAYGPYGSRAAGQAYNPRTGAYGQTRQGSNVYGNWGTSAVQRGDSWAQTAHVQNYQRGTSTSGIRTDSGAGAVSRVGPGGERNTVGRTARRRHLRRPRRQRLPPR